MQDKYLNDLLTFIDVWIHLSSSLKCTAVVHQAMLPFEDRRAPSS